MINRRKFLGAVGLSSLALKVSAATVVKGVYAPGVLMKQVYVDHPVHIAQDCNSFCWAASIAMIFAKHGHPISQERIVAETFGTPICVGAPNVLTIAKNLSRPWVDDLGQPFSAIVTAAYDAENGIFALTNDIIVNELRNDCPLLICNTHHAMVLATVDYLDGPLGIQVQGGGVLDPWPYSPNYHPLPPAEFMPRHMGGQMMFLASVQVF